MCGISGIINLDQNAIGEPIKKIDIMNQLLDHRGPDDEGCWVSDNYAVAFGHKRLSIIDLDSRSKQPMSKNHVTVTFNGEIYNYQDIKHSLKNKYSFTTTSDTEIIPAAYLAYGKDFVNKFRGMYSFAIWDEKEKYLLCARDRFGIKPFYYTVVNNYLYFASEAKALIPFMSELKTDSSAFSEYLIFQYTLGEKTLFHNIKQLQPGHTLEVKNGKIVISKYWDIKYEIDWSKKLNDFKIDVRNVVDESLDYHLVSDVEVGAYVSGGIDSSLLYNLASKKFGKGIKGFHGRFKTPKGFDESVYAQSAADFCNGDLIVKDITHRDFEENINNVIYHLDFPTAGPGSFPQYMVSQEAAKYLKVLLGGQGGDEIFGGYARYIIAYLEQCLKASIDGTSGNGNYLVTLQSIIPNLEILKEYKPLIKKFWSNGLFEDMDFRYLSLLNKSTEFGNEINWNFGCLEETYETYRNLFNNPNNVENEAYFDKMTHFDFKTLLPALLQVEDRVSMAHGLESRVPLIDTSVVELLATIPADKKFPNGQMKYLLKSVFSDNIPSEIANRKDKMGFPVPLQHWFGNELHSFLHDTFSDIKYKHRDIFNLDEFKDFKFNEMQFSRKTWALLALELWHQNFHDKFHEFQSKLKRINV